MGPSLRMADYEKMSAEEREKAVRVLVEAAMGPPSGGMNWIDLHIRAFEKQYEISSEDMERELREGKRKETHDVARWLITLHAKRLMLARQQARV